MRRLISTAEIAQFVLDTPGLPDELARACMRVFNERGRGPYPKIADLARAIRETLEKVANENGVS